MTENRVYQRYDDTDDYDPHEFRQVPKPTSNIATLIHILKGCVGTGILAMPYGFSLVGSLAGCVYTLIIGLMCGYSIYLLVNSTYNICKVTKTPLLSYGEAMIAGLQIGPEKLRKFSPWGGVMVHIFYLGYQVGTCAVYIVFVATNVKDIMDDYKSLNIYIYFGIFFVPFGLIVLVQNLKVMVPISLVATIFTFASFAICLYYIFQDMPNLADRPVFKPVTGFPVFLGITMFAIQAIPVVVAIENNMKTPKSFVHGIGVFYITQTIVVSIYISIGLLGYWKYGEDVKSSITLSLPQDDIASKISRLLYALAIFGSYCLQMYPAIKTIWDEYLLKHIKEDKFTLYDLLLRYGFLLFTYILAMSVPLLGLIISLVGNFCLSALGFIFPPIMDCLAKYPNKYGCCKWIVVKNIIFVIIGIHCWLIGTYFTMLEIINQIKHDYFDIQE